MATITAPMDPIKSRRINRVRALRSIDSLSKALVACFRAVADLDVHVVRPLTRIARPKLPCVALHAVVLNTIRSCRVLHLTPDALCSVIAICTKIYNTGHKHLLGYSCGFGERERGNVLDISRYFERRQVLPTELKN